MKVFRTHPLPLSLVGTGKGSLRKRELKLNSTGANHQLNRKAEHVQCGFATKEQHFKF